MAEPSEQNRPCARCAKLERRVAELEARLQQVQARYEACISKLQARVAELEGLLLEATRAAKRQAAPFSRNQPKTQPQKPGRPVGHPAAHRPAPTPAEIAETISVPLDRCPSCGGPLEDLQTHEQIVSDLPEVRPTVRRYVTHSGHCPRCNRRVRSRHPDQTSDAGGAAGNQLGPNALALAADLKHRLGLSYGKIVEFFASHYHLHTCPGSLARAGQRLARMGTGTYHFLRTLLRLSPVVHGDETGWRIAARSAWLWVFTNRAVTLYVIRTDRSQAVIREMLGGQFAGVLVSDCFLAYDPIDVDKQKCLGHLLKDLSAVEALKSRGAVRFSRAAADILRDAIALKRRGTQLSKPGYAVACGKIEARMDRLLTGRYADPDNRRLAQRMIKHREHLFTFLYHQAVEPTNNAAERALRPAVISRKLSGGNRSPTGALAHSILASLCQTARQNGCDFLRAARLLLQHRDPDYIAPILPTWAPACALAGR
jgi:transposase